MNQDHLFCAIAEWEKGAFVVDCPAFNTFIVC